MEKIIGIIPAREGSKGIVHKNLCEIDEVTLVGRAAMKAVASNLKEVYVYSDDSSILVEATKYGAIDVPRPKAVSQDTTTTEETIARFLSDHDKKNEVKAVMVIQCTSPFYQTKHINEALDKWATGKFDSVIGAFVNTRFMGNLGKGSNEFIPVWPERSRRQEMDYSNCYWTETGSIYLAKKSLWVAGKRIGRRCGAVVHYQWESVEIDEPIDVTICQAISRGVEEHQKSGGEA